MLRHSEALAVIERLCARLAVRSRAMVVRRSSIRHGSARATRPIAAHEARRMVDLGEYIKSAANDAIAAVHPDNPAIKDVTFTLFGGPPEGAEGARKVAVVVSPGRLDRSPCGTGTSARLAALIAKGELAPGDTLIHESVIGTRFTAEVAGTTEVGGIPAVVPRLSGRGWIFATHEFGWDPSDPFPRGFTLTDTWGPAMHPGIAPDTGTSEP